MQSKSEVERAGPLPLEFLSGKFAKVEINQPDVQRCRHVRR
jgi:hypothetical protein